jgi:hypothetical protein
MSSGGTEGPAAAQSTASGDVESNSDKSSVVAGIATTTTLKYTDDDIKMMSATLDYDYDPDMMARYIHFYKTGQDIHTPSIKESIIGIIDDASPAAADDQNNNGNKKQKRTCKKHISPIILETRRTIQLCCRDNNLPLALQTFHKALRNLIKLEAQVFYQLLNLCEGSFTEREGMVHVGTPKQRVTKKENDDDNNSNSMGVNAMEKECNAKLSPPPSTETILKLSLQQRLHHADHIHSLLTSLHIPLIEQAYTALIRLSSRGRGFERAEKYLDEAERTPQCKVKLRMYSSLIRGYCGEFDANEDEEQSEGDKATEADYNAGLVTVLPTHQQCHHLRERLVQALRVWKRMYDHSGGLSTGHPNYHTAKQQQQQLAVGDNAQQLFGEGVSPKISLSECEYVALMKCATTLHDVPLMERIMSDLADMVLVPGVATTESILNWFRSDRSHYSTTTLSNGATSCMNASVLEQVALPPRDDPSQQLGSVTNDNGKGWIMYWQCRVVDSTTGELSLGAAECSSTTKTASILPNETVRYRLKPVELTSRAWRAMRDMNNSIVLEGTVEGNISQYQGGGKGKKRPRGSSGGVHGNATSQHGARTHSNMNSNSNNNSQWRTKVWKKFEAFIEEHPPYNIVIDGANVGYFEQNFANAPRHIDYKQIDGLLRHLLEPASYSNDHLQHQQQYGIILFLHERHFSSKLAPSWANNLFQSWDSNIPPYNRLTVYRTPTGFNDDWFWMHAALIHGGKKGMPSVLAITNDEMRDHHFQMLAQGSFLRWKERHQVHFDFGQWNKDLKRREVLLQYPSSYSRRIQRVKCDDNDGRMGDAFVIPLPKKGDERRFADGLHVAEEGVPNEEMYIVVQRVV